MVGRNAAWRQLRREPSDANRLAFQDARRRFHMCVRLARSRHWENWLANLEFLSANRPRDGARACRQQFSTQTRALPTNMTWPPSLHHDPNDLEASREAWRAHFEASNEPANILGSAMSSRISRRIRRLREQPAPANIALDTAFHTAELLQSLTHCHDSAVGPDGLPYAAFRVDLPWWHDIVVTFCNLLLTWHIVPSTWKAAHIVPILKRGSRHNPANYRPISLTSAFARLFERMILQRVAPIIDPQLDATQAGFRWGSDEQA